ncbi:MAG: hypothetical protein L3K13_04870 [Thermoplasmata archaeon]|nr:hypothetical protein [Thermoplasmata archaeon]
MRVRRGSGSREDELLSRAERLRKSVEPLLPRMAPGVDPSPFRKLREKLEGVRAEQDDARALDRSSRWGEPLARAYAGLLRFYLDPSPPALLTVRDGGVELSFAPFGRTDPEAQIAVQGFDDPARLLAGYRPMARKGLHFFATPEGLVTTGDSPDPPKGYLAARERELPYRFTADLEGRRRCTHLARGEPRPYLEVGWAGANTNWQVCRGCAREDAHLLSGLVSGAAVPRPEDTFSVDASLGVDCRAGASCAHASVPGPSRSLLHRYRLGRLDDATMLREYLAEAAPHVRPRGEAMFLAGGVCFGPDRTAFVQALHPTRTERAALDRVLPGVRGLFEISEPSASLALERLWKDHAEEIVAAIEPDPVEANRLASEARRTPGRVSELLKRAAHRAEERERQSSLPRYRRLSAEGTFVDAVARAQAVSGAGAAERVLLDRLPREGKERGLAWALLGALGRAAPHAWQFSDTEQRFGAELEASARALLAAAPGEYHEALGRLLLAAGTADWGELDVEP